jgi:hypothetical protein
MLLLRIKLEYYWFRQFLKMVRVAWGMRCTFFENIQKEIKP